MKKILSLLSLSFLLIPALVSAATFNSNDIVSVTNDLNDDFYAAGNRITVDSKVNGDIVAAGREINTNGEVAGDITAAAETITISGPIKDDVRVAGRHISINTTVGDDVFATGQDIELSDTTVNGDVYAAGQNIIISGTIKGTVRAAGETIQIQPGTHIKGNLLTYGNNEPVLGKDVVIDGTRQHHMSQASTETTQSMLLSWLKGVITWFILGSILLYLFPRFTAVVVTAPSRYFGLASLTGAIWLLLFLPVSIVLLISGIGIPAALILILLTIALYIVASGYSVLLLGSWVLQRFSKDTVAISWQHILLGAVLYKSILFIPGLGAAFILLITLLMLGSILVTLWRAR
jgi:cytoskeletal protein CcmA (bactofilin family)